VRGEDDDHVLADLGEQVVEADALTGIESCGRLVDDDQSRIAEQCLGDAEALAHAARECAEVLFAYVVEIRAAEQCRDGIFPLTAIVNSFEDREVIEQRFRGNARIDAELLRQVTEHAPDVVLLAKHVDVAERDGAGVGFLQRGDGAHQRRLAGAVRAEETEHAGRNRERDVLESFDAVRIGLREAGDVQCE
jgi:hypothetical protein